MKTNFNYNYNIKFLIVFILFIGLFSLYKSITLKADNTIDNMSEEIIIPGFNNDNTEIKMAAYSDHDNNIVGWAWSPDFDWLSLNCLNDFDGLQDDDEILENTCETNVDYGLYWENGEIKGCAWAPDIGWICFSDPGDPYTGLLENYSGVPIMSYNYLDTNIDVGYAGILGYEYIAGQAFKLGFPVDGEVENFSGELKGCFNCYQEQILICNDPEFSGTCENVNDDCGEGSCIVVYSEDHFCDNCLQYNYCTLENADAQGYCTISDCDTNDDIDCPSIDQLINVYSASNCSGCNMEGAGGNIGTGSCKDSSYIIDEGTALISCDSCTSDVNEIPGTIIDKNALSYNSNNYDLHDLCGFAWNGFDTDGDSYIDNGVGYLQFSPWITWDFNPYFTVERGSIYSGGDVIGSEFVRPGAYNARYLIKAKGNITNILSNLGSEAGLLENIAGYQFLEESVAGKFGNQLGTVDVTGLETEANEGNNKNKYGSDLVLNNFDENIENKVMIIVNNDLTLSSQSITGSGVVIVEGDLYLNGNINYNDPSPILNLNDISSLVWIVKGNVNISSTVEEIVGTFIVLGDGTGEKGKFNSGTGINQLIVSGNVIAKKFILEREYSGSASEKFINDGRIQANPPPGLIDFSKALPRFSNRIN